jgi:tubulin-folding cofactor B
MSHIPVFVTSEQISSERRISPTWTIGQLKARLETITGIAPYNQRLRVYGPSSQAQYVYVNDEQEDGLIGQYNLAPYGRIHVEDDSPVGNQLNINDTSLVEKYVMSDQEYSSREDSVLAWKKRNQLGRFDPTVHEVIAEQEKATQDLVHEKEIKVGLRCRVVAENERRGVVKYVGPVKEISKTAPDKVWVGVEFDEPVGKNDGSLAGTRYFDARPSHGSFVKPDLVEVGAFPEEIYDDDEL